MNPARRLLVPALAAAALACATSQSQTPPPAPAAAEKPTPPPATAEAKPAPEPPPAPPPAPPSPPVEIDRAQYTMTAPAGYKEIDDPRLAQIKNAGGVALGSEPSSQGLYPPSIMLTPIPAMKPLEKPEECQEVAGSAANASATTLKASRIVQTKAGPSCQFDLVATSEAVRAARGTLLVGPSAWSLTCNYDTRDPKALADCDAAAQSFAFKPGLAPAPEEKAPAKAKKGGKKK